MEPAPLEAPQRYAKGALRRGGTDGRQGDRVGRAAGSAQGPACTPGSWLPLLTAVRRCWWSEATRMGRSRAHRRSRRHGSAPTYNGASQPRAPGPGLPWVRLTPPSAALRTTGGRTANQAEWEEPHSRGKCFAWRGACSEQRPVRDPSRTGAGNTGRESDRVSQHGNQPESCTLHQPRPSSLLDSPIAPPPFFLIMESLRQLKSRALIWLESVIFKTCFCSKNEERSQKTFSSVWEKKKS